MARQEVSTEARIRAIYYNARGEYARVPGNFYYGAEAHMAGLLAVAAYAHDRGADAQYEVAGKHISYEPANNPFKVAGS